MDEDEDYLLQEEQDRVMQEQLGFGQDDAQMGEAGAEQEQDPFDLSMPNETRKTFTYSALTSSEHFPRPSSHPQ